MKKVLSLVFFWVLLCILMVPTAKANVLKEVKKPMIVDADLQSVNSRWGRPIIIGLTQIDTDVMVYIDGKFSGVAKINIGGNETNNFYYQPVIPLGVGVHEVEAIAKSKKSLSLSYISQKKVIKVNSVPAPTLVSVGKRDIKSHPKPTITGLIESGTKALIYIDGVYNGKTDIVTHKSGTANFSYRPFLNLNVGTHKIMAVTETEQGEKSGQSKQLIFKIENSYPAPVLYNAVKTSKVANKPFIVGVAKNDSKVRVYIDKKLDGEFVVENDESGAASFVYVPKIALTNGDHLVYTTAINSQGKESVWSNFININIPSPSMPAITVDAVEEMVDKDLKIDGDIGSPKSSDKNSEQEVIGNNKDDVSVINENKENELKSNKHEINKDEVLGEILNATTTKKEEKKGVVNEKEESQSELKLNLFIFLAFMLAIIGWIFWVNKELIKEKQEEDGKDE